MTLEFSSKTPQYAWLSNFADSPFTLEGVRWPSVEHFYQAQKFAGAEAAERIRGAETALKARKAGQDRSLAIRPDWESVKEDVMRRAVAAKFGQGRKLRELLLATGDHELVHTSGTDTYWGRTPDGAGDNRLGSILMELRARLRDADGETR